MKPEIGYPNVVIGPYMEDLIGDIEYNMRTVKIADPYFEQLSVEKFTLEHLLQKIGESGEILPIDIVKRFVRRIDGFIHDTANSSINYTLSIARDAAQSLLDFVDIVDLYSDDS